MFAGIEARSVGKVKSGGKPGTNWIGRLLEVVRSELVAVELGLSSAASS